MGTAFDDVMVEVLAAEMRRTLGLMPWPAFEALARERYQTYLAAGGYPHRDPDRGTGRSTRGVLLALARARLERCGAVHVGGKYHDVRRVKDLVKRLGLGIHVIGGDWNWSRGIPGGVVYYTDHHLVDGPCLGRVSPRGP